MRSLSSRSFGVAALIALATPAFAQSRIDQLSAGAAVSGTDAIANCQGCGVATAMVKTTLAQILTYIQANLVSVTAGTPNVVITPSPGTGTFTVGETNTINSPADGGSHTYAIVAGDVTKQVILASTFTGATLSQATGSFGSGFAMTLTPKAAITLTATTSKINGIAGATGIKIGAYQSVTIASDNTDYNVVLGEPQCATQTGTTFIRDDGTCATPSGSGNVTAAGTLTSGGVVIGGGTQAVVTAADITFATGILSLGTNTSELGGVKMFGSTSGNVTIEPNAVAGTNIVLTLPATTDTLVGKTTTDTLTNKTLTSPAITSPTVTTAFTATGLVTYADLVNGTGNNLLRTNTGGAPTELTMPTGMLTWLATPSSANLAATLTDETGSGAAVFATSPTLVTPALGTPSALVLTNATALPAAQVSSGALANGMTATTQAAASNDTKLATDAYVDAKQFTATVGWIATVNPTGTLVFVAPAALTIKSIVGNVEVASGGTSTVSVFKAASATACGSGTIQHSGSFNANGTAATNQTLTLVGGAGNVLAAGDRICITTTGTTGWTAGTGVGGITVAYTVP